MKMQLRKIAVIVTATIAFTFGGVPLMAQAAPAESNSSVASHVGTVPTAASAQVNHDFATPQIIEWRMYDGLRYKSLASCSARIAYLRTVYPEHFTCLAGYTVTCPPIAGWFIWIGDDFAAVTPSSLAVRPAVPAC
jgi:hypothetical protein